MKKIYAIGVTACVLAFQSASAAVIENVVFSIAANASTNINLSAKGPVDWAIWSGTNSIPAPSEQKLNGDAIGDITHTLDQAVFISSEVISHLYSWSDGTVVPSAVSAIAEDLRIVGSPNSVNLDTTASSISFTVKGDVTKRTIHVWGGNRLCGARMVATINGLSVTNEVVGSGTLRMWSYSADFVADNPDDLLTLTLTPYTSMTSTAQEYFGITAAAVEAEGFYLLSVTDGSGSGSFIDGAVVPIVASSKKGLEFSGWTGDTQYVANVSASSTTVTMPAAAVSVAASYVTAPSYTLSTSVVGSGSVTPASTNVVRDYSADFVITANAGHRISQVTTNGAVVPDLDLGNFSLSIPFTWENVQSNGVLGVTFIPQVASDMVLNNNSASILGSGTNYVNLTEEGPVDWAAWSGVAIAPAYSKTNGVAIMGNLQVTLKSGVDYAANPGVPNLYSWTDGSSTNQTATDLNPTDPRLTSDGSADMTGTGSKISFTVQGSTIQQTVKVWGYAQACGAQMTATLNGSNVVTQVSPSNNTGVIWTYAISYKSDSTNDALKLTLEPYNSQGGAAQERLGIGAVAVSGQVLTSQGTPYAWLDSYYTNLVDEADYEAADLSDSDGDGHAAWQEYLAGTDPTDENSVFAFTGVQSIGGSFVLTWASVPEATYSVSTNINLVYSPWGVVASGIAGQVGSTSYTSTVGNAVTFFKVERE